jgi:hypothetical protein
MIELDRFLTKREETGDSNIYPPEIKLLNID